MKKIIYSLLMILMLAGCVNLKEVRDFAGESAKFSGYTELTARFRDTYEREQPYLFGETDRLAKENDAKRRAMYKDLISIHESVSLYMKTLATLAGEDTFDLSKGIDSMAGGIKAYPDLGLDSKHVDAYTNVTKTITKWALSGYQQHAVRDMLKDGGEQFQTLLEGMSKMIFYYKATNDNEKKSVLGFLEVQIALLDVSEDQLLLSLARVHAKSKEAEYKLAGAKYDAAEKGIRAIVEGHRRLLTNVDNLSSKEAKDLIKQVIKDIKSVRADIQYLQN